MNLFVHPLCHLMNFFMIQTYAIISKKVRNKDREAHQKEIHSIEWIFLLYLHNNSYII